MPFYVCYSMKLLSYTNAIYLATEENVIRLPVNRCQRFRTHRDCLNAMDPYCGWNSQKNECTPTPNNNPRAGYWQQSLLTCPIMSDPVSKFVPPYQFLMTKNGFSVPKYMEKCPFITNFAYFQSPLR